ncbi:MAG: T9SS type A sorting domain-containing protein [Ignavibacteriaceae bacterium]|nr:T9SS type A sorting domain-containing protein [Ignavibacteriaceae bacterium]
MVLLLFFLLLSLPLAAQAKYEPADGAYIGAFIVNDPVVNGSITSFETFTGKKHSSYFSYAVFGQPFPVSWVTDYASKGNIVQIAFEPNNGLDEVIDGDYIREWARAARRTGAMIFLRWACEMNGSWVAWYGNPEKYKEKFRLMHHIMKEEAPNVAMVWAPNDVPNDPLNPPNYVHSYYPGDEYVDWVGIDFYGVYFHTNGAPERKPPGEKLKIVYDVYASRKPIIICEWAAAHYTNRVTPAVSCSTYCTEQMDSLYGISASRFPRLKSINWFSMNSLTQNGCNFTLTENPVVLNHYKSVISSNYFLSQPFRNVPLVKINSPSSDSVVRGVTTVSIRVDCDTPLDSVNLFLGEGKVQSFTSGTIDWDLNTASYIDGIYELRAEAYSSSGYHNYEKIKVIIDNSNQYTNVIIDDVVGTSFSLAGSWNISTSQPDRFGPYYHYSIAGNGSNKAFWNVNIPMSGNYNVYAYWSAHPNRATDAPYVIHSAMGEDTIRVNQEVNGGKWNSLGRYSFQQGDAVIELNNNANEIVIADAVRVEWSFNLPVQAEELTEVKLQVLNAVVFPNPATEQSRIRITGATGKTVKIVIYDLTGRELSEKVFPLNADGSSEFGLINSFPPSKRHQISAGVYLLEARTTDQRVITKMVLIQ